MLTETGHRTAHAPCRWFGRGLLLIFFVTGLAAAAGNPGFCQTPADADRPALDQILAEPGDTDYPVYLYFVDPENGYLVSEVRRIREKQPVQVFCRHLVEALLDGPRGELVETLPGDAALRAVYVTDGGIAYVDLTGRVADNHPGGIRTELMTVFSIVNTLVLNVPAVDRVQLLIDGQEADTLAGHIDIRFPLKADMLLVR